MRVYTVHQPPNTKKAYHFCILHYITKAMVFSQLSFLYLFLPVVMLLYFFASDRARNVMILVTGLLFYAWGEPFYVLVMLISTLIDYTAGRLMDRYDDRDDLRRVFLLVSVCMNVGLLAAFKYSDFIFDNINALFGSDYTNPVLLLNKAINRIAPFGLNERRVELPIGISFFTFQSMSYTIDLYRREIKVQKSFVKFAGFVSLFPQIVAGPIVRYADVAKELDHRTVSTAGVSQGFERFAKGLAKKVLLANSIGTVWAQIKATPFEELSAVSAWAGILAFTFQIYYDFSGYSDMAVGLGRMLGFTFPENFDHPDVSTSVTQFWRRWHMTLGGWFRSYVYIPLGGNRCSTGRNIFNLLVVWGLTGLWHGASWNFVLWGLYFGVLLIMEKYVLKDILPKIPAFVRRVVTFLLVVMGWVLFDTESLGAAGSFFRAMFGANGLISEDTGYLLRTSAFIFLICILLCGTLHTRLITSVRGFVSRKVSPKRMIIARTAAVTVLEAAAVILCTSYIIGSSYNPFLYFRF